jgi:hypothetical protein
MYRERLKRNFIPVIEEHGYKIISNTKVLESISPRQIWNVSHGATTIKLDTLEAVADEIGADMMDFFRE